MLYRNRSTCLGSVKKWQTGCALLATAASLSGSALAQSSGLTDTIAGGSGSTGFLDGIKGSAEFNGPSALALRGNGSLFIADFGNNAVRALRLSDGLVTTFAFAEGTHPVGLVFDSKTNLFVANQGDGTITKYDYFAHLRQTLRPPLTGGNITALAIDRNDSLYVAEQNGVVIRLNSSGVNDTTFYAPSAGAHEFRGVAVSDDGTVFVSDAAAHVLWRFKDGAGELFAGTLNQSGAGEGEVSYGQFNRPQQIAIGPNGSVVVADRGNHQIRVASCEGIVTRLYGIDPSRWFDYPGTTPGSYDSPVSAEFSELRDPVGIAADRAGNVYDSELYYNLIRTASGLQFPLACNVSGQPPASNAVPSLVLAPSSGFYPNGVTVIISASNSVVFSRDTKLFYTLDGSEPTKGDIEIPISDDGRARLDLAGPVDLAKLRVRAFVGDVGGPVVAATPTQVPTVTLSPNSGYYPMGVDIAVTSTNGFPEDTLLYYTTDGSIPTTNSISIPHDGTRGILAWRNARLDLRSLKVRAFLGPNEGATVSGKAVSFPGAPSIQGEVGVPPARAPYHAGIGSFYILPIVANLRDGQQLQSLQFVVEVAALPGSPILDKSDLQVLPMSTNDFIQVLPASTLPPDSTSSFARDGTNHLLLAYFGTNSGFNVSAGYATVALLGIQFRAEDALGNTARVGGGYTVHIASVSGTSDGLQTALPLNPMRDITITFENLKFREGDTAPAYWYNAGDFGDGVLTSGDVNSAIFAAFGFRRPFALSDAFAAMDVYRVGILENVVEYSDAATILRRSVNFQSPDLFRIRNEFGEWEGSSSATSAPASRTLKAFSTGTLAWSRDVTIVGGVKDRVTGNAAVEIPVYMKGAPGVSVSGMQFVADVVPVDGAPAVQGVTFFPSSMLARPTSSGSKVDGLGTLPSTVYARWDDLPAPLQGTVLLGYIQFVTPGAVQTGQHYNIVFHDTGGAAIDPETRALTAYLFQSIHGEVWPWIVHPEDPQVSDDWKVHFFGTMDSPEAVASEDPDGDGFSNLEEYVAGSDPNAADWHVKTENGHVKFRWVGQAGKSYSVEKTQDFKNWNAVSGRIAGQDAFLEYNELTTSARAQFYRINIQ